MHNEEEDTREYEVVMNHEEQYSIWLKGKKIPDGWHAVGKNGLKPECLAYIEEAWTDMRPLSLRKHMEAYEAQQRAARIPASADGIPGIALPQNEVVAES
ncbi:MAG: MbtH family protein [Gemmatimonadaceae bacterium]